MEQFDMQWTQKSIMEMFKIDNFTDVQWKKYEIDMENVDNKLVIKSFAPVDERRISYQDFETVKNAVLQMQWTINRLAQQETITTPQS